MGGSPASEKEVESWSAANKFTIVLEAAGLNATELGSYCRERGLYPEQVDRWRKAARLHKREIKLLQWELRRKDKALVEAAVLLIA